MMCGLWKLCFDWLVCLCWQIWEDGIVVIVNLLCGMCDIFFVDKVCCECVFFVICDCYLVYGFDEIEMLVVEDYDCLYVGIGGDNEKFFYNILCCGFDVDVIRVVVDDLVVFLDFGFCYDLIVLFVWFYVSNCGQFFLVFCLIQIGLVWCVECLQKGCYCQFVQCDIDIMGDDFVCVEVELMVVLFDVVDVFGFEGVIVCINDC